MGILDVLKRVTGIGVNHRVVIENRRRSIGYWTENSIYLDNIFNKIGTDVAMSKFKHIQVNKVDGEPDKINELEESGLTEVLLYNPNPYTAPLDFWSSVVRKIVSEGRAVVLPIYENSKSTEIKELYLCNGTYEMENDKLNVIYQDGNKQIEIKVPIGSLWIFDNPKTNLTVQLNQITRLIDNNLRVLSEKLDESSTLRGFLKLKTMANDNELKEQALGRTKDIMDAAKENNIGYLQNGEEFQELNNEYGTAAKEEMEFLKQQLYNAFGFNDDLFTCNYSEDQYRAYFQSVIKVYIRVISEEIQRKQIPRDRRLSGEKLLMYVDLFDIASLKDLNEFAFKQRYAGNINANEVREIFGYGGYVGGDIFETNKNAVQIGSSNSEGGD